MADAATTQAPTSTPTGSSPAQENTPVATLGFGPREYADTERQAAGNALAVAPIDISMQDVIVRSQALTFDVVGKEFSSNSDFRQKVQDQFLARLGLK